MISFLWVIISLHFQNKMYWIQLLAKKDIGNLKYFIGFELPHLIRISLCLIKCFLDLLKVVRQPGSTPLDHGH